MHEYAEIKGIRPNPFEVLCLDARRDYAEKKKMDIRVRAQFIFEAEETIYVMRHDQYRVRSSAL